MSLGSDFVHKVVGKSFHNGGKKVKCNTSLYWGGRVTFLWKDVTCPECLQCLIDTTKAKERRLNKISMGARDGTKITSSELVSNQWF